MHVGHAMGNLTLSIESSGYQTHYNGHSWCMFIAPCHQFAALVVNYGISNKIVLEIP